MFMAIFKVGDVVKHKAKFLQSIQWYTDVPKDGIVRGHNNSGYPKVQWCDDDCEAGVVIHPDIMLASEPDYSG